MKIPIVKGINKGEYFKFWCIYCQEYHHHGRIVEKREHRNAHCSNNSPLALTGYYCEIGR